MLDQLSLPIVQAPMAGGLTTPALVAAVSDAGGLGFLAGGLASPQQLAADIAAVRAATDRPFGVNLFSPTPAPGDPEEIAAYAERILPIADELGVALGEPSFTDDRFDEKLGLLYADLETHEREIVVSFVFGCPPPAVIEHLKELGAWVWVTVTQVDEALSAAAAGADAVIAQGSEAGGHRGAWVDDERPQVPVLELVGAIRDALDAAGHTARPADAQPAEPIPIVAAGALMSGEHIALAIGAGAAAAQLGTAFMLTPEAGTNAPWRASIASDRPTAITRAFSGRRARGIVNEWMDRVGDAAPSAYPELVNLTSPLRKRSVAIDSPEFFSVWAGERHAESRALPVAALMRELAEELASVGGF